MRSKAYSLRESDDHPLIGIRFYNNTQDQDFPPHWHMPYEFQLVVEGHLTVTVENEQIRLLPGDMLIIPSGVVHRIDTPPTGRRYYFMMDREQLFGVEGLLALENFLTPYVLVHGGVNPQILRHYQNAVEEYNSPDRFSLSVVRLELTRILIDLLRQKSVTHLEENDRHYRRKDQTQMLFVDISDYVTSHCTENLTPQTMADMSGYSRFHFERLFYDCLGYSFHEYLTRQRLNLCKRMLGQTNDAITSIAVQSGFGSIATFNRVFQKYEGMSPTEYRKLKQVPTGKCYERDTAKKSVKKANVPEESRPEEV